MLIVHATDLSGDDEPAFVHAAALAAASGAKLVSVHAGAVGAAPDAGVLAARWRRTIDHEFRRLAGGDEVVDALLEAIGWLSPSWIVLGAHARRGFGALLRGSVGEALARNVRVPTLIVPDHARGFVDVATGKILLRRILIPVGMASDASRGIEAARHFAGLAGEVPSVDLVHVGPLDVTLERLGVLHVGGVLEEAIVNTADRLETSLIVMPTRGHDSVSDALAGSHTEHVIRESRRPVLVLPP